MVVLIGTIDAAAQIDDTWSDGYVRAQHLPWYPDPRLVSARHGLTLLTDQVHLDERAAGILAELVSRSVLDYADAASEDGR